MVMDHKCKGARQNITGKVKSFTRVVQKLGMPSEAPGTPAGSAFSPANHISIFCIISSFPLKSVEQNLPFHLSVEEADSEADVIPADEIFLQHTTKTLQSPAWPRQSAAP